VGRLGAMVIGMACAALILAYLAFGWPVLLVGAPLLIGTALVVVTVILSEGPRRKLEEQRAARWDHSAQLPGGLMSGFFEIPRRGAPSRDGTSGRPPRHEPPPRAAGVPAPGAPRPLGPAGGWPAGRVPGHPNLAPHLRPIPGGPILGSPIPGSPIPGGPVPGGHGGPAPNSRPGPASGGATGSAPGSIAGPAPGGPPQDHARQARSPHVPPGHGVPSPRRPAPRPWAGPPAGHPLPSTPAPDPATSDDPAADACSGAGPGG
jgi:hypothetical protein